jgi:multidrug efflux pump subunit AcrA (membrane-fusion protein)
MFLVTTLFTNLVRSTLAVVILLSLATAPVFAQTATYNDAYTIQGFSQPRRISQVASSTTGILHSLAVNEGDRVLEGECLVRLDREGRLRLTDPLVGIQRAWV